VTVFIGFSTLGAIVVHFFFPETRGLSLEDMGRIFGDYVPDETPLAQPHYHIGGKPEGIEMDGAEKEDTNVVVSRV
jgi:hypothetical protein